MLSMIWRAGMCVVLDSAAASERARAKGRSRVVEPGKFIGLNASVGEKNRGWTPVPLVRGTVVYILKRHAIEPAPERTRKPTEGIPHAALGCDCRGRLLHRGVDGQRAAAVYGCGASLSSFDAWNLSGDPQSGIDFMTTGLSRASYLFAGLSARPPSDMLVDVCRHPKNKSFATRAPAQTRYAVRAQENADR